MDFLESRRRRTTAKRVEENTGKVEDDLERNGEEGSRSCGVAWYCQRTVVFEKLKVKAARRRRRRQIDTGIQHNYTPDKQVIRRDQHEHHHHHHHHHRRRHHIGVARGAQSD